MKLLFVCMGNICRSPSAQGVFEKLIEDKGLAEKFEVDSAGTHGYHIGGLPDSRSLEHALRRGVDLRNQRARKVCAADFEEFDLIIAMDDDNFFNLQSLAPTEHHNKIKKMMSFAPHKDYHQVPDPYYGGEQGFELVLDLLEQASEGLLEQIKRSS